MELTIDRSLYRQLIGLCLKELPNEACGVILGRLDKEMPERTSRHVENIFPIANTSINPKKQFLFETSHWIQALYFARQEGLQLIGIYHSHPVGPAVPSLEDARALIGTFFSYWIISFANPNEPQTAVFRIQKKTGAEPGSESVFAFSPMRLQIPE